jgi:hypothetical protein
VPTSPNLTVGTPDSNGLHANMTGYVKFRSIAGDPSTNANEADVAITMHITDVRLAHSLADYTGELHEVSTLRLTDRANGTGDTGTVQDLPIGVTAPCTATADPATGADCGVSTTINAVMPGAVVEGNRSIWNIGQVQVYDGGEDGVWATDDNSLFAVQGLFFI